jgi:predicted dehydrogenase
VNRATRAGLVLAVGHVERSNPAVIELKRRLQDGEIGRVYEIQARRQSPFPPRVRDVGVTIDLATHDIDLIRFLLNADPVSVYARTARRLHSTQEDMLVAVLTFPEREIATLQVNWLTPTKIRDLMIIGERGMFLVHHLTQDLIHYRYGSASDTPGDWTTLAQLVGQGEGDITQHRIRRQEPLELELRNFVESCAGGTPAASGEDGVRALEIAEAILESAAWDHGRGPVVGRPA